MSCSPRCKRFCCKKSGRKAMGVRHSFSRRLRCRSKQAGDTALHPSGYWWRSHQPKYLSTLFHESNERSLPCLRTRLLGEPVIHPPEIERGSRQDVLQMDFCLPAVACLPETEGPNPLGERPLNSGTCGIRVFECLGGLPVACGRPRL